jgi:hypothetical protein
MNRTIVRVCRHCVRGVMALIFLTRCCLETLKATRNFSLHSLFQIVYPPIRVQLITPDFKVIYSNANRQHKDKCEKPIYEMYWSEVDSRLDAASIM